MAHHNQNLPETTEKDKTTPNKQVTIPHPVTTISKPYNQGEAPFTLFKSTTEKKASIDLQFTDFNLSMQEKIRKCFEKHAQADIQVECIVLDTRLDHISMMPKIKLKMEKNKNFFFLIAYNRTRGRSIKEQNKEVCVDCGLPDLNRVIGIKYKTPYLNGRLSIELVEEFEEMISKALKGYPGNELPASLKPGL